MPSGMPSTRLNCTRLQALPHGAPPMSASWTSAFGRACGVLLDAIVRWLALSRINPNVLTFMGLLVNTWAAVLFASANADNQRRMFIYAGLVIIFSGLDRKSTRLNSSH